MSDSHQIKLPNLQDPRLNDLLPLLIQLLLLVPQPWRHALVYRFFFDADALSKAFSLKNHAPDEGMLEEMIDVQYRPDDKDGYLDVFYPKYLPETNQPLTPDTLLPTIVWVHGGGWISGDKFHVANYLRILASYGYTVVGINYSISPEHKFPLPLQQINEGLGYLVKESKRFHINTDSFVLAGDSAGSHIATQIATLITNSEYANKLGLSPVLQKTQLKGMVLACGVYDAKTLHLDNDFIKTAMWSCSGNEFFKDDEEFMDSISVINYINDSFPPSFITAGDEDFLLEQSVQLKTKLENIGRPTSLYFPTGPGIQHEYQFDLDKEYEGKNHGMIAKDKIIEFLQNLKN